jgi:hypothetical protein
VEHYEIASYGALRTCECGHSEAQWRSDTLEEEGDGPKLSELAEDSDPEAGEPGEMGGGAASQGTSLKPREVFPQDRSERSRSGSCSPALVRPSK